MSIRVVALLLMLLSGGALAQPSDPAAAAPAARIEGGALLLAGSPSIRVEVPQSAVYVGGDRFILYGVADCEVHVFVEADAERRIQRFYWIQFEGYLPSRPDANYDYADDGNRRMNLWGDTAWVRPGFGPTDRAPRPGSDSERVRSILADAGYTLPPHLMNVRFVRLLDDPQGTGRGRRELMLIYAEDMAASGFTSDDLRTDGQINDRARALEDPLVQRAAAAFEVTMF